MQEFLSATITVTMVTATVYFVIGFVLYVGEKLNSSVQEDSEAKEMRAELEEIIKLEESTADTTVKVVVDELTSMGGQAAKIQELNIRQLKAIAKDRGGIKGYGRMNKHQLITAIGGI